MKVKFVQYSGREDMFITCVHDQLYRSERICYEGSISDPKAECLQYLVSWGPVQNIGGCDNDCFQAIHQWRCKLRPPTVNTPPSLAD